jgi:hypothetical protein
MKTTYTITLEYGSDFQKQFIEKYFDESLKALEVGMQAHHKDNSITIKKDVG